MCATCHGHTALGQLQLTHITSQYRQKCDACQSPPEGRWDSLSRQRSCSRPCVGKCAWALRCRCDMIASYSTPPVSRFHPAHAASADRSKQPTAPTHEWMRMAPSVTRHRSYRSSTMRAHGKTLSPWSRHGRRAASKRRWSGGAPAKLIAQRPPCNVARPRADSSGDNRSQPRG